MVASAHTDDDPLVVDLLAGQTEDIGDVLVWNDADTLYVKFVYEGLDCGFLEVHLQVDEGEFSPDILTKKGNPIPGQFEKSYSNGCFIEHTFTYNLADEGFALNDTLVIAAHAAMGQEDAIAIVSGDGKTIVTQRRSGDVAEFTSLNQTAFLAWEPGPNYPNDGPDDIPWEANSLWDQNLSTDLSSNGADWIWESYRVLDPVYGTVLTFQRTFDIGYPIDGNLLIACDNGYEVFLNGTSLGSDNVYGDNWSTSNLTQQYVDVDGWNAVGSYYLQDDLLDGTNVLTIDAANEYYNPPDQSNLQLGTVSSNPGACIFTMDVDYYTDGETAWGDGEGFDGKNWATYFEYTVQGVEVETSYPETGNAYIGYEDWPNGDFDYNDFGMYFSTVETYWGTTDELYLTKVTMTFTAVIYDSGMDHKIHITRPIVGGSTYTVGRGVSDYTDETPAGTYAGSEDVDVTLFNTAKYLWPAKQINEIVTIEIIVDEPALNPKTDLPAPRWDLDPFMANYDPWEVGTLYGSLFHIEDMQDVTAMSGGGGRLDTRLIDQTLPYILVVPDTDWVPPYEDTCISGPAPYGPYGYFYDYYSTSGNSHPTWYTEVTYPSVGWGGLSWAP